MALLDEIGLTRLWSKIKAYVGGKITVLNDKINDNTSLLQTQILSLQNQPIDSDRVTKLVSHFQETISFDTGEGYSTMTCELEIGESYHINISFEYEGNTIVVTDELITATLFEVEGMALGVVLQNENVAFACIYDEYQELVGGVPTIIQSLDGNGSINNAIHGNYKVTVQKAVKITDVIESAKSEVIEVAEDYTDYKMSKDLTRNPVLLRSAAYYNSADATWEYVSIPNLNLYQEIEFSVIIGDVVSQNVICNRNCRKAFRFRGMYTTSYHATLDVMVDFANNRIGVYTKIKAGWSYPYIYISDVYGRLLV